MEKRINQLLKFNQSKENPERLKPFVQIEQKCIMLAKQYANSYGELHSKVLQEEYCREYAKGGQVIHRGLYSPSSLDVITGGCDRGRLLKRTPKGRSYDYEYIFNEKGNLICCKHRGRVEILIYKETCVLGLDFLLGADCLIERISQCWYEDTKLIRYECALLNSCDVGEGCTEINVEEFAYADNILEKVNWYRYSPAIKLLTHEEISLYRDAAGNVLQYAVKELDLLPDKEKTEILEQRYSAKKREKLFHDIHRLK